MGDEELLAEGGVGDAGLPAGVGVGDDLGGEAGEIAPAVEVFGEEGQGDEAGAEGDDRVAELLGDLIAEAGGAHLGGWRGRRWRR